MGVRKTWCGDMLEDQVEQSNSWRCGDETICPPLNERRVMKLCWAPTKPGMTPSLIQLYCVAAALSMEEASQRLARVVLGLPGHASIHRTIEAVIRSWIYVELDRHSGAAQSIRVGQILFEKEIEAAH
jgi:hypothetical protein